MRDLEFFVALTSAREHVPCRLVGCRDERLRDRLVGHREVDARIAREPARAPRHTDETNLLREFARHLARALESFDRTGFREEQVERVEEFVLRPHKPVQHLLVRLRRRRLREQRVVSEPVADELRRHIQVLAADASAEARRRQVRDIARERPKVAHMIGDALEFEKEVEVGG